MAKSQTGGNTSAFTHSPLLDDRRYIRLLTINNLDLDKTRPTTVSCDLTTWPIAEAPEYLAISYTWGNEKHLATILVNGKQIRVRQNCEYALRQAKWYNGPRRPQRLHYWVDAICIKDSKLPWSLSPTAVKDTLTMQETQGRALLMDLGIVYQLYE